MIYLINIFSEYRWVSFIAGILLILIPTLLLWPDETIQTENTIKTKIQESIIYDSTAIKENVILRDSLEKYRTKTATIIYKRVEIVDTNGNKTTSIDSNVVFTEEETTAMIKTEESHLEQTTKRTEKQKILSEETRTIETTPSGKKGSMYAAAYYDDSFKPGIKAGIKIPFTTNISGIASVDHQGAQWELNNLEVKAGARFDVLKLYGQTSINYNDGFGFNVELGFNINF